GATDFHSVDLASHEEVLHTAERIETLGVEAINGAVQDASLQGPLGLEPLEAAAEIVSVEARHAATLADLRSPHRATEDFSPRSFEAAKAPEEVLNEAGTFLITMVRLTGLPAREET
ncbi:MAG TPA: ferritin-like domain-containing protein, partial [Solirubrobacteraceae bacterium]|nr:ferritin-like domain-containing protein [Solirubrobacteraceae bacterium]